MRRYHFAALAALVTLLFFALGANDSQAAASKASGAYDGYVASDATCPGAAGREAALAQQERAMRCLINYARRKRGLRPVRANRRLDASAVYKAEDILRCQDFSHTACGNAFISVFRRSGYASGSGWSVGENIAWFSGSSGSPQEIMRTWLESDGHRKNIWTASWRDGGISLRVGTFAGYDGAAVWSSTFGRRG